MNFDWDTGVLLVDAGTTLAEARAIDADVHALTGQPVSQIVLTHHHFDHVLGSAHFTGARIHCAPKVAETLATGRADLRADAIGYGADPEEIDRTIRALRPSIHETHGTTVHLGCRAVTVIHPGPGHTNHDLIVVVPGRRTVVFCGDLVEESGDPAIDAHSDVAAWPATLDVMLAAAGPDALLVPGHGAVVDVDFVRLQQQWLRAKAQ
ncbi:MBL fold metallo-hydrolase [Mycobacterium sp. CBMA293]|uniref:MBL fold metallo-hydrolase n=1 Tax=unclassified Mycolicibacterium TaxID=2636767 RepID=UPI001325B6F2|nr:MULTISPECIES: MBL fold metallo-hydrolase [unclassified Mycolicibacterium]MUL47068.1 MBL fold metallo-hydrolase [Mycolicibacterium sp. CBMA 360]MUL93328.1 MBL fold metallo-hydrolase [Mycolicibacterium sp. CBMA 230]MUM32552.1 MBL fold metallo-hydrolase [Mycolicibacterium sp. CBMA 361]MUL58445.1 MBL fold metallo-hydrolase [Mycolicibacterium sp. CBMA 335]MUL73903.1 MBL fold metallo-hydrolase [Mycolicibacterium sp. CBMA 311]